MFEITFVKPQTPETSVEYILQCFTNEQWMNAVNLVFIG